MKFHPDRGGDVETMKAINAEYDRLFERVKNTHYSAKHDRMYEKETNETPEEFKDLISRLLKMKGIKIEIIGCFIWVSGDTRPHKEELKALGLKWSTTKKMWYKSPEGYRRRSYGESTIEQIRSRYRNNGTYYGRADEQELLEA